MRRKWKAQNHWVSKVWKTTTTLRAGDQKEDTGIIEAYKLERQGLLELLLGEGVLLS